MKNTSKTLIVLVVLAISVVFSRTADAQIVIEISRHYSSIDYFEAKRLASGESVFVGLDQPRLPDRYQAFVEIRGGIARMVAIDGRDIQANNSRPKYLIDRRLNEAEHVDLPAVPSSEGVGVWFINPGSAPIDIVVTVLRTGQRSSAVTEDIKKIIEPPIRAIELNYNLPSFKVSVRPCGEVNAFSSPDIVICSELISHLHEKGSAKAIIPIVLHELGHTLLNLWGLPGYNNEDMVDEFAAAFLVSFPPDYLEEMIKWLESRDSRREAVLQLALGGRHTISVQRARNIREAMSNPKDVMRRWSNFLAPYRKK